MPQAVFRVRPVARCTASMPGHSESVLAVQFSPNGRYLASGSGDTTLRFWDLSTQLPKHECKVRVCAYVASSRLCRVWAGLRVGGILSAAAGNPYAACSVKQ
eukprot:GHUV01029494.1.p2 GENE.GHUV01029494.1~~GHUV01029494.1.p2  ORF type:complete len:102 (-),score=15.84 GHUV01029494.1:107-412(-)